jgi:eukaryotic-like serine/threonine-protein kinase
LPEPDLLGQLRGSLSDRYLIEREIGSGGMARVFVAQDVKHGRNVAIKVLRPELRNAVAADRFLREIQIAATLTHPHILPLYDSGNAGGLLYYVMPFVEGESLRDLLTREKQLPIGDALRITSEVADALAYAHERGVLHRDIKPDNILLAHGHAVVADFGIARAVSAAAEAPLTATGVIVGTLTYMSPEQAIGQEPLDGRSDVFSLGCVLYEMLAGQLPFIGPTPQALVTQRLMAQAPMVTATRPEVSAEVARVLAKALATELEHRFPTARDFAKALSDEAATLQTTSSAHARTRSRGRVRRSILAGSVGLVLIALAAWAALGTRDRGNAASPDRIAVLPFAVHGSPQLAYLGEGVVDLLSRNLDGVDNVHCVDPGTVMTAVRHAPGTGSVLDAGAGRDLVRRVGAGAFILGSVTSVGKRIRIQAALYQANGNGPPINATVQGDSAQLLELVDRLAGQLLVERRPSAEHRMMQTAALTTHSLTALKAFLGAEQNLRNGQLDSAISGYQRAIAEDSAFALAYYRLAIAAGWHDKHALSTEAVTTALHSRGTLTKRDQHLMSAYSAYRRGKASDAERQYRAVLEDFPDDLEAEFELGDLLFNYNPLRGRPRLEARPMLDRVLDHDPGFL